MLLLSRNFDPSYNFPDKGQYLYGAFGVSMDLEDLGQIDLKGRLW